MKKSVFDPRAHEALVARLDTLAPDAQRRWGRMTAAQAVCHLSDSLKVVLGDRPLPPRPLNLKRRAMRFAAFTLPIPWPKGVQTSAAIDADRGGTPPGDFAEDVGELKTLLARMAATDGRDLAPHHVWGSMGRSEWGRYIYRHVDHHLRQFGA